MNRIQNSTPKASSAIYSAKKMSVTTIAERSSSRIKMIKCDFCQRKFNEKAGERHIEHCRKKFMESNRDVKRSDGFPQRIPDTKKMRSDSRASNLSLTARSRSRHAAMSSRNEARTNSQTGKKILGRYDAKAAMAREKSRHLEE